MWLQPRRFTHSPCAKFTCVAVIVALIFLWKLLYDVHFGFYSVGTATCIQDDDIFLDSCDLSVSQTEFQKMMNESGTFRYPAGTVCHRITDGVYVRCIHGKWIEFKAHIRQSRRAHSETGVIDVPITETELIEDQISLRLICPDIIKEIIAGRGQVNVQVFWPPPTIDGATGDRARLLQISGPQNGSHLGPGTYDVAYLGSDIFGNVVTCSREFQVLVRRCPHTHTYLYNGHVYCNPDNEPNVYGAVCRFSCNDGYQLVGAETAKCHRNSHWSVDKPMCQAKKCWEPPAVIEHGSFTCNSSDFVYKTVCILNCDQGFTNIDPVDYVTCQADQSWTSNGKCIEQLCPVLETPENLEVICSNKNRHHSECLFACQKNYQLQGEAVVRCLHTGVWSSSFPYCTSVCPDVPKVPFGYYDCESLKQNVTTCHLHCRPGFLLTPPSAITCVDFKNWSLSGQCVDVESPQFLNGCSPNLEIVANALGVPNLLTFIYPVVTDNSGLNIALSSQPSMGFAISPGTTTVTVTATDVFDNSASCSFNVSVTVKSCKDPAYGVYEEKSGIRFDCINGFVYGAVCNVSCINRNTLKGPDSIKCEMNKLQQTVYWAWNGSFAPYCQELCHPGQRSNTGYQPCELCPKGTYQPEFGSTRCLLCPYGWSTVLPGGIFQTDCEMFGLSHSTPLHVKPVIQALDNKVNTFSFLAWLNFKPDVQDNPLIITSYFMADSAYFNFSSFTIYVQMYSGQKLQSETKWYHLAVIYRDAIVTVYVNANKVLQENVKPVDVLWESDIDLEFSFTNYSSGMTNLHNANSRSESELIIAGSQITQDALTDEELSEFQTLCDKRVEKNVLNSNSLETSLLPISFCNGNQKCATNYCGIYGQCHSGMNGAQCICNDSWSGERCQIPPDYCRDNSCVNGATCESHSESKNYTCLCLAGYTGELCNKKEDAGRWSEWTDWSTCSASCGLGDQNRTRYCITSTSELIHKSCLGPNKMSRKCLGDSCPVDGVFGLWSEWSQCSTTCGEGVSTRHRLCDSPAPANGGSACNSELNSSFRSCNSYHCPVCRNLSKRTNDTSVRCFTDLVTGNDICHVCSCRERLPSVVNFNCLSNDSVSEENLAFNFPECSGIRLPLFYITSIKFGYKNVLCSSVNNISKSVFEESISKKLNCPPMFNFNVKVKLSDLSCFYNEISHKDSINNNTGSLTGVVIFKFAQISSSLSNNICHLTEVERSAELKKQKFIRRRFLSLISTCDAITYTLLKNGVITMISKDVSIQCLQGSGFNNGYCVECPPGSYSDGRGQCVLCAQGFYQSSPGMSSCLPCPPCMTTIHAGSYSLSYCVFNHNCTGLNPWTLSTPDVTYNKFPWITGLFVTLLSVIFIAVYILRRRHMQSKSIHIYSSTKVRTSLNDYSYKPLYSENIYDTIPEYEDIDQNEDRSHMNEFLFASDSHSLTSDSRPTSEFLYSENTFPTGKLFEDAHPIGKRSDSSDLCHHSIKLTLTDAAHNDNNRPDYYLMCPSSFGQEIRDYNSYTL